MAQAVVSFRIDPELKQKFELICNELGMSMSTAFTMLAKKTVRDNGFPLDLSLDPFYSASNLAHLRRGVAELNAGKGIVHELIED